MADNDREFLEFFTWVLDREPGQSLRCREGGEPSGSRIRYQVLLLPSPGRISCLEERWRARTPGTEGTGKPFL